MSSSAAWLQSTSIAVCGSYSQIASALHLKRLSNTWSVCLSNPSDALVLSSRSRPVDHHFIPYDQMVYGEIDPSPHPARSTPRAAQREIRTPKRHLLSQS